MKQVCIETNGCQRNVADTELMFGVLLRDGFERTDAPDDADDADDHGESEPVVVQSLSQ
mgnify:CR=1 FL=1